MKRERRFRLVLAFALPYTLFVCQAVAQEGPVPEASETNAADDPDAAVSGEVDAARAHFQRGVDYYAEGDFSAALIEFERAYALKPAYRLLYNLGQTAYELRDYAAADHYFADYLALGASDISEGRRAEVERELTRLKTRVSSLRIRPNLPGALVRIDDRALKPDELASGIVRVSAGQRHVTAEKRGYAPVTKVLDVLGGDELEVPLRFGPPLAAVSADLTQRVTRNSGIGPWPWVTGIVSAAAVIGAASVSYAAYRDSQSYDEQLRGLTTQDSLQRASSSVNTKALIADVLWGTAAIGAVVTLVWVLSGDDHDPKQVALGTVGIGASSLVVHW